MMKNINNLRINAQRLAETISEIGKIGETPNGGSHRLALTDVDGLARDLLFSWSKAAGYDVSVDRIGNMFIRRTGMIDQARPVGFGSHLDTQPSGGKYDGVFGVMAGLEVLRSLDDANWQTHKPLELIVWTNEEGSRFAPCMLGSGVYSGRYSLKYGLKRKDATGKTVGEELKKIGYDGKRKTKPHLQSYIEPHIEQGPVLEQQKKSIGVVTGALGQKWYDLKLTGTEAHAGPTPMDMRRDALLAAANIITGINQMVLGFQPQGRATVGELRVYPNSRNVVPGRVELTIDIRHPRLKMLHQMDKQLKQIIKAISEDNNVRATLEEIVSIPPIQFDPLIVDALRQSAANLNLSQQDIVSGAGHDAVYINDVIPTAMIFIPCRDGISHNESEFASEKDMENGANVLLRTILMLDQKGE